MQTAPSALKPRWSLSLSLEYLVTRQNNVEVGHLLLGPLPHKIGGWLV